MSDKLSHNIDVTDSREPEDLTVRDIQENELIEYRINTMTISEVCEAATNWLALTLLKKSDEEIAEMHKDFFNREIH
jgi:hypothetical protein